MITFFAVTFVLCLLLLTCALVALIFRAWRRRAKWTLVAATVGALASFVVFGMMDSAEKNTAAQSVGFVNAADKAQAEAAGITDAAQWEQRKASARAAAAEANSRAEAVRASEAEKDKTTTTTSAVATASAPPDRSVQLSREQTLQNLRVGQFGWDKSTFFGVDASFVIFNQNPFAVKDVRVTCVHATKTGTEIDSNTSTIYERLEANSQLFVGKFRMGFVHSEAHSSACKVVGFVRA